jgi:hypothetical protein
MDLNPSMVDEPTVRRFVELIHTCAAHAINGGDTGVLQLVRIHPADESISVGRYRIGDVEHMTRDAIAFSTAGHNVYIERADLRGNKRGDLKDTLWVFALVIDSDSDKGRAWTPTAQASIIVETSPGNAHFWFCLARAVDAAEGKTIGERMRKSAGADQDTGVMTQCYRVAGTPNFPSESKRKRGRVSIEPTKILEQSETSLEDALAAFADTNDGNAADTDTDTGADGDEAELPADLLHLIREGVDAGQDRSAAFHSVVAPEEAAMERRGDRGLAGKVPQRDRVQIHRTTARGGGALLQQARRQRQG